jgi:ADP-ribose pyrophosphatase YjhB (NUDIX family)
MPTDDALQTMAVLLVRRTRPPYEERWALPGGWVYDGNSLTEAALWQLNDKTGLHPDYLEQLYTFGLPDRDPREHRIAVTYYALVKWAEHVVEPGPGTSAANWYGIGDLPVPLAFDNEEIIDYAVRRLRSKVDYAHLAFRFLEPEFTLSELRLVYESVLGNRVDPANFRRRVEAGGTVAPSGKKQESVPHRPARLYRCGVSIDDLVDAPRT